MHGVTSREWNLVEGQTGQRRVWYKFADRMIRNDADFYCALNDVTITRKHGYTSDPYEWPWSSLTNYLDGKAGSGCVRLGKRIDQTTILGRVGMIEGR